MRRVRRQHAEPRQPPLRGRAQKPDVAGHAPICAAHDEGTEERAALATVHVAVWQRVRDGSQVHGLCALALVVSKGSIEKVVSTRVQLHIALTAMLTDHCHHARTVHILVIHSPVVICKTNNKAEVDQPGNKGIAPASSAASPSPTSCTAQRARSVYSSTTAAL